MSQSISMDPNLDPTHKICASLFDCLGNKAQELHAIVSEIHYIRSNLNPKHTCKQDRWVQTDEKQERTHNLAQLYLDLRFRLTLTKQKILAKHIYCTEFESLQLDLRKQRECNQKIKSRIQSIRLKMEILLSRKSSRQQSNQQQKRRLKNVSGLWDKLVELRKFSCILLDQVTSLKNGLKETKDSE